MGEVPDGHEELAASEKWQLETIDEAEQVQEALGLMSKKFEELAAKDIDQESREEINDLNREMFWLNGEIDSRINQRPDAERQPLRTERTAIFIKVAKATAAFQEIGKPAIHEYIQELTSYKTELEGLLDRLDGGQDDSAHNESQGQ